MHNKAIYKLVTFSTGPELNCTYSLSVKYLHDTSNEITSNVPIKVDYNYLMIFYKHSQIMENSEKSAHNFIQPQYYFWGNFRVKGHYVLNA